MADEQALLESIWEHPHDDAPRLVYADALEETGEPVKVARAEFIRLQCELAQPDDGANRTALEERAAALEKEHRAAWTVSLPGALADAKFNRGFLRPEQMMRVADFLQISVETINAVPLWHVRFLGPNPATIAEVAA